MYTAFAYYSANWLWSWYKYMSSMSISIKGCLVNHWGLMTHICAGKLIITGSDNRQHENHNCLYCYNLMANGSRIHSNAGPPWCGMKPSHHCACRCRGNDIISSASTLSTETLAVFLNKLSKFLTLSMSILSDPRMSRKAVSWPSKYRHGDNQSIRNTKSHRKETGMHIS